MNSAQQDGGAIFTWDNTKLSFDGTNNFIMNLAHWGGGAIFTWDNTKLRFSGTNNFIKNSAENENGGAIQMYKNTTLSFNGNSNFSNNYAVNGGAILAPYTSRLVFNGTIHLTNNRAKVNTLSGHKTNGGGVYMGIQSTFSALPHTTVYWENNHASLGGAIYVHDASPISYCTTATQRSSIKW